MSYKSKAEQKRELEKVSKEYDKIRSSMMDKMLNEKNAGRPQMMNTLYWNTPHYLHQFSEGHATLFSDDFKNEVKQIFELKQIRQSIKDTPIDPKPEPKNKRETEIVNSIKEIMERNKKNYITGLELHKHFGYLPVYVNAHLVTNAYGTTFVRHFFYMDGKLTALNVILAVLDTIKREEKENEKK